MRALSQAAVRGLMIAALGLQQRPPSLAPATKTDVRQMIQRLHGVQLDRLTWHENRWRPWMQEHAELVNQLVTRIREHGPVRSADFARAGGAKPGWWNWTDEKTALEGLWMRGELMVDSHQQF